MLIRDPAGRDTPSPTRCKRGRDVRKVVEVTTKGRSGRFAHHPQTEKRFGLRSTTPATKTCRWGPRVSPQNDCAKYRLCEGSREKESGGSSFRRFAVLCVRCVRLCCRFEVHAAGDVAQRFVGADLIRLNRLQNRDVLAEAEQFRPPAQGSIERDLVVLHFLRR